MSDEVESEEMASSLPPFSMVATGFDTEENARSLLGVINAFLLEISRYIDLSSLDGVTVAYDYDHALAALDRGVDLGSRLTASSGITQGIAMTPAVIRDGVIKSHIVLNANFITPLLDQDSEYFQHAIHVLAHESAHVQVNAAFDSSFPGMTLRHRFSALLENLRWQVVDACWQEYAACHLSAGIGEDQTRNYTINLLSFFEVSRSQIRESYESYLANREGSDAGWTFVRDVVGAYGNLLKYASYCLGNLDGLNMSWRSISELNDAICGSWFEVHMDRLSSILNEIMASFGSWESLDLFWEIGDLALEMLYESGVLLRDAGDNGVSFDFNSYLIRSL